jgi:competence protein ComEC
MEPAAPASRGAVAGPVAARPAVPAAGLFIAGVLLHRALPHEPPLWIAVAGALAACAARWVRHARLASALLAVALLFAASATAQIFAFQFPRDDVSAFAGDAPRLARLEIEILTPPRVLTDPFGENRALPPKQVATARVVRLLTWDGWIDATGDVLLQVLQPHPRLQVGQRVAILGMLQRPAPAMNPGQFDWAAYYREQRILASVQVPQASNVHILHQGNATVIDGLREHARRLLAAGFPAERALDHALLRALLLGDSDPQLRDVQDQFQRTGTSHHLAISGMHVAVLGGFLFLICRTLCLSPRITALTVVAFVLLYGVVALPSPPVVRSVLLCLAFGVGLASRRSVDALQLLAVCVLAMLVYRPLDLYNAGFQLSFGTVLGLILFTTPLLKAMNAWRDPDVAVAQSFTKPTPWGTAANWADGLLLKALAASVVAWAVSMPLIAWHFEQLNPWAVLAGLLLAPFVLAALILGFMKVLLTLLWPGLAETWVTLTAWPITWMRGVVDWLASWPRSDVPLPPPPVLMIVAYYGLLLTALIPFNRVAIVWALRGARAMTMLALLWLPYETDAARRRPPADALRVTLLAVGGGQCAVVEPPSGRVVLVDAGSNSLSDMVTKCLGPFLRHRGCTDVDSVIVSHANYDHFSAAADVVEAYEVREVLTGAHFARHARDNLPAAGMLRALDALQRPPRVLEPGQRVPLARDTALEVLWPPPDAAPDLAANDVSLVLRLTHAGRTILFTGDIQDDAMRELLRDPGRLRADVLVAPHHGSSESLTAAFVEAVNPSAVVSSNDRTLSRKQVDFEGMIGSRPLLRTHDAGAITIEISAEGAVSVRPFVGPASNALAPALPSGGVGGEIAKAASNGRHGETSSPGVAP